MIHKFIEGRNYTISEEKSRLNLELIHQFLSKEAYWSRNIPYETVKKSVDHSMCFGVYQDTLQVGFARVITDFATIAYLGDVFILKQHRGLGLSKWLLERITEHENLQGLRRWILLTGDAHELYRKYGWQKLEDPAKWMERYNRGIYGH